MVSRLTDKLLRRVELSGGVGKNIIAFSGGVDSSLVAALVHKVFPENSFAVIGKSAALPAAQLELARRVAERIGINFQEIDTAEREQEGYVANDGSACFYCKTELYSTLEAVALFASKDHLSHLHNTNNGGGPSKTFGQEGGGGEGAASTSRRGVVLFNGTNAEDKTDPTRVGLKAAESFGVASPLEMLSKDEIRLVAKALGLPNWNHAASPCLRSRLALGVLATDEALQRVEAAEVLVRNALGRAAALELDHSEGTGGVLLPSEPHVLTPSSPSSPSSWRLSSATLLARAASDLRERCSKDKADNVSASEGTGDDTTEGRSCCCCCGCCCSSKLDDERPSNPAPLPLLLLPVVLMLPLGSLLPLCCCCCLMTSLEWEKAATEAAAPPAEAALLGRRGRALPPP
mmetsp:Transcript_17273/g.35196  ORF Transcript_17273/g.35196 Transcript_17273/m.35196 type:complete len:404 (-) Transcript_17273:306-1517(-)